MTLSDELPVIVFESVLPVASVALAPVSTRFSMFAPKMKEIDERTSSMPPPMLSFTESPAMST